MLPEAKPNSDERTAANVSRGVMSGSCTKTDHETA